MLAADGLLHLWERVQHCSPLDRALCFLTMALPQEDRETLAGFDLGLRDWHLLRLRMELFGPALSGWTECPACGERLEIEFDATAIFDVCPPEAPSYTSADGRHFRLPT